MIVFSQDLYSRKILVNIKFQRSYDFENCIMSQKKDLNDCTVKLVNIQFSSN